MRHRSARPDRQYAAIPNTAMRDDNLSIEARGLLALLMTYSDNWTFRRDHLMGVAGVGKDKFGKLMKELIDAGYISTTYMRDGRGLISGRSWVINDDPAVVREMRITDATVVRETRRPENPSSGESAAIRKPTDKKTNREDARPSDSEKVCFPEDWTPNSELIAFAKKEGLSREAALFEARLCSEHHRSKGQKFADLGAAYRSWILRAANFRRAEERKGGEGGAGLMRRVKQRYPEPKSAGGGA